jgi:transposase
MAKRIFLKEVREKQLDIFGQSIPSGSNRKKVEAYGIPFVDPDPADIYLGLAPLKEHLESVKQKTPFVVRKALSEQDWSAFEASYKSGGKPPYAPRTILGIVLYGIMNGITSLRSLENMARVDLGCMWVSGGVYPDHATIGRFILLHSELLTDAFFNRLTAYILGKVGVRNDTISGDGTIIQAACSNYNLLKMESVKERTEQALSELASKPDDEILKRQAAQAVEVQKALEARALVRKKKGKPTKGLRISSTEPDAVVQPQKHQAGYAPSYKPSVLANEKRIVIAQAVHPSAETTIVPALLEQCKQVTGEYPKDLLLDAGYCGELVINEALSKDINLLCPEGRIPGKAKASTNYSKAEFVYDSTTDTYRCPAGELLTLLGRCKETEGRQGYTRYGTKACQNCLLRENCTQSKTGRKIKRYAVDEAKEALRQVMQQPKARKAFSQRKSMVEPVFSVLRGLQGMNRFRRKGLLGVKLEFSLHILAYNLGRLKAILLKRAFYSAMVVLIDWYAGFQEKVVRSQPIFIT